MSEMGLHRTLFLAPIVGTVTAFRIGVDVGQIWGVQAPELLRLSMESWRREPGAADRLERELYQLARDASITVSNKVTDGINELEALADR